MWTGGLELDNFSDPQPPPPLLTYMYMYRPDPRGPVVFCSTRYGPWLPNTSWLVPALNEWPCLALPSPPLGGSAYGSDCLCTHQYVRAVHILIASAAGVGELKQFLGTFFPSSSYLEYMSVYSSMG